MNHHFCDNDKYRLAELRRFDRATFSDGDPIYQSDGASHRASISDDGTLTAWTTRLLLCPELYDHVEEELQLHRDSPDFPTTGELIAHTFDAQVEFGGLGVVDLAEYSDSAALVNHLARCKGVTMPVEMRHDLHADATVASFGDLHVDHLGAVLRMEAWRRDTAALHLVDPSWRTAEQWKHGAVLEDYGRVLTDELKARRTDTQQRHCQPDALIGALPAEWIRDARVRELRGWPGGEHTQQVLDELTRTRAAAQPGAAAELLTGIQATFFSK